MSPFSKKAVVLSKHAMSATLKRYGSTATANVSATTNQFIEMELAKSAHNYHPIPRVLSRGQGVYVWDVDNKVWLFHLGILSVD
jgi:4-aminobutyrate aminotransferase-like enzyme